MTRRRPRIAYAPLTKLENDIYHASASYSIKQLSVIFGISVLKVKATLRRYEVKTGKGYSGP